MPIWKKAIITKIEDQTPTTKAFWVKVPGEAAIDFKPGQFITMDLPIHEKRHKRWRSYSIANEPNGSNVMEFSIVYLEGGLASEYLFKEAAVGTEFSYKGPAGVFTLPENIESELVFVCTGTGVAPFRSMIKDLIKSERPFPSIHLIFGTRKEENILYREEFEELEKTIPNFFYTIVLSRQEDWEGIQGYVHQVYEKLYSPKDNVTFYLCGWSNMVDEARERLEKMDFDKKQVKFELYG
ncbi:MAG: FAD-binding oxidoreductase [Bacteroidota bacterium]